MQCQLLEKKLVDSQLFFEFEKIPKKKQNAEFSSANHADNIARNRLEIKKKKNNRRWKILTSLFPFLTSV